MTTRKHWKSFCRTNSALSIVGMVFLLLNGMGCSTELLHADRAGRPSESEEPPTDLVQDAARIRELHLFPKAISEKIHEIQTDPKNAELAVRQVKDVLCSDKNHLSAVYRVHLVIPHVAKGVALDDVRENQAKFIEMARKFLKGRFFYESAQTEPVQVWDYVARKHGTLFSHVAPKTVSLLFNGDYVSCFENQDGSPTCDPFNNLRSNYAFRERGLYVPYVKSADLKAIDSFYQNQRQLPDLSFMRWIQGDSELKCYLSRQFFTIFSGDQAVTLAPKAVDILKIKQIPNSTNNKVSHGFEAICEGGMICGDGVEVGNNLYNRSAFMPSQYEWRVEDVGTVRPLQLTAFSDLAYLIKNFTFAIPRQTVCQYFFPDGKDPDGEPIDCAIYENPGLYSQWGFDEASGVFSPKQAIARANDIWLKILEIETLVKEEDLDDGSIMFEVRLGASNFCSYGTAIEDMKSR